MLVMDFAKLQRVKSHTQTFLNGIPFLQTVPEATYLEQQGYCELQALIDATSNENWSKHY